MAVSELSLLDRISSYSRLQRVTAWVLQFVTNSRVSRELQMKDHLSAKELIDVEMFRVKGTISGVLTGDKGTFPAVDCGGTRNSSRTDDMEFSQERFNPVEKSLSMRGLHCRSCDVLRRGPKSDG